MTEVIDFKSLNISLLNQVANILPTLLPSGKMVGTRWTCGDVTGGAGTSFSLDCRSGKWKDFATGETGSDITALYAHQNSITMLEAAKQLRERFLGGVIETKYAYPVKAKQEPTDIIKPPLDAEKPPFPKNSQHYVYRDLAGDILFYIVKCVADGGKKFFYPLTFTSKKEWVKKQWPHQLPLYNLTSLKGSKKPVLIVEGEKACDAAIPFFKNYDVITWAGGAQAWKKTDWSPLQDREVLIWPDADEPGIQCAQAISSHLKEFCSVIKIINTDKTNGWDAFDAINYDKWTFQDWATWAKPLLTTWNRPLKVEILPTEEPAEEEMTAEDLIPTDEFPVNPNLQFLFNKLQLQMTNAKIPQVIMNASNVVKLLRHQMPEMVWRDVFYNANMTKWNTGETRIWSDEDTNNLFVSMQVQYDLAKLSKNHVEDAVNFVASLDKRNEPQDWLNGLEWDGQARVDDFFVTAMRSKDEEWTRVVSRNFWISLVARVLNPGCQVDEMAVFESPQGTKKTSALLAIGGKWYGEVNAELKDKDFDQGLVGKIIVEFGELSAMKNSDIELVKKKITCRVDQYRPSYGRRTEKFPRTCIFAGTTNEKNYLKDSTGGRRFNPIVVGDVDLAYIIENREQLFAEAVERFKAGESWWEYPKAIADEVRESRRDADEWEVIIAQAINSPPLNTFFLTTLEIWKALGGSIDKLDRQTQLRIGKIMRKLGYENRVTFAGGTTTRTWSKI